MKLIHLSDLHLGKRVNEFSMLEDQKHILWQILGILEAEQPDGVLIAGDIYDKPVPPGEAVTLLDEFLVRISRMKPRIPVFIISGNHDSAERIAFGGRLLATGGIYLSPVYTGEVTPITLEDEWGRVNIYLLPFIKPAHVRAAYPEEEIETYTDAMRVAIEKMQINPTERNILVCHQFAAGGERCESEAFSVGGTDCVDLSVFAPFDYVALGHLHGPQTLGNGRIRYCGTPLKYSFSEKNHHKSVTVVETCAKGTPPLIRTIPLTPMRDLREIRGSYNELTNRTSYEGTPREDYLHVILTDEEDVADALERLRVIYPNIMKLDYDNTRTRNPFSSEGAEAVENRSPMDLLSEFYEKQNGQPPQPEQIRLAEAIMEEIQEGGER